MSKQTKDPEDRPRGEAGWKAEKARVAAANEAAYKRSREERAVRDEERARRQVAAEREENAHLPTQPHFDR